MHAIFLLYLKLKEYFTNIAIYKKYFKNVLTFFDTTVTIKMKYITRSKIIWKLKEINL